MKRTKINKKEAGVRPFKKPITLKSLKWPKLSDLAKAKTIEDASSKLSIQKCKWKLIYFFWHRNDRSHFPAVPGVHEED